MCGISAIIGKTENKEEKLKISLSKISHRGEYLFEYKIFENVALGANRLAIVDEKTGNQPQENEKGNIFVVQNGEIFNYKELVGKLSSLGHTFRTGSDTEVLVHLWEEYKEDMISLIDSEMFAFIIYDKNAEEIFVARDRLGVKPLYYGYDKKGGLYFASEIKALVCFDDIENIHEFPPGHYFYKNTFVKYFEIKVGPIEQHSDEELRRVMENAVAKRVQTELPVVVFLSGGVDSSFVMELATRHNHNVTALILGGQDSSDYKSAVSLCKEKNSKYKVLEPEIDYEKELSEIVYFVESYDPNIVRHSFANNIISKFAKELGFKIVLTGEGADEIFAGYNEFLEIEKSKINLGCKLLLDSMSKGNLMRIDKMAMRYAVETRCPFFDIELVNFAMSTDGDLKVGEYNGKKFTKLLFRKIAQKYLPENTAFREKIPFANGAGMNVGLNYKQSDGVLSDIANRIVTDEEQAKTIKDFPEYKLETKEEVLLFKKYREFGYDKFTEGKERLIVKDVLRTI